MIFSRASSGTLLCMLTHCHGLGILNKALLHLIFSYTCVSRATGPNVCCENGLWLTVNMAETLL